MYILEIRRNNFFSIKHNMIKTMMIFDRQAVVHGSAMEELRATSSHSPSIAPPWTTACWGPAAPDPRHVSFTQCLISVFLHNILIIFTYLILYILLLTEKDFRKYNIFSYSVRRVFWKKNFYVTTWSISWHCYIKLPMCKYWCLKINANIFNWLALWLVDSHSKC